MRTYILRATLTFATFLLAAGNIAYAQQPPATPAPKGVASVPKQPPPVVFGGQLRGFYFTRTNLVQNKSNPNRMAWNGGGKLYVDFHFNHHWTLGSTYFFADPTGFNGSNPGSDGTIDNTMPGFGLSTLGEAYLQYKDPQFQGKLGNQVINTPWANASDSRIKPVAFQGLDTQFALGSSTTLTIDRMLRFEGRTSSAFLQRTLITDAAAGQPAYPVHDTSGFGMVALSHKFTPRLTVTLYNYQFYDIANMLYGEAKYLLALKSPLKPFVAAQFVSEHQTGAAYLGIIDNQTLGAQLGASLGKNVDFTLGYNRSPWKSAVVTGSCSAAGQKYFLPMGGTPNCIDNGNGTVRVYYGGIASPYTDNYATDPLYTTSMTQGLADRHSAGNAWKAAATIQSNDKRVKIILSEGYYTYDNGAGTNLTREFNGDVTYFFSKVGPGPYKGFSIRHRYGDRSQPTLPFDFKYNRTQLQYDF